MVWRTLAGQARRRTVLVAAAIVVGGVSFGGGSGAASTSRVKGKMALQAVTGPSCASAVGVCFTGTTNGKLKGMLEGVGTSLVASVDTPTTGVVFLTSAVTLTTGDGQLFLKAADALRTAGAAELSGVWTIVGATGKYAGASGVIQVTGTFSTSAGGKLDYSGLVMF